MSHKQNKIDKDAIASVLLKYLRPSQMVQTTLLNHLKNEQLEGCAVVGREERKIDLKMQRAIFVGHSTFKNGDEFQEVYAATRWFKLQVQGLRDLLFQVDGVSDLDTALEGRDDGPEVPAIISQTANTGSQVDVDNVLGLTGVEINDDWNPASGNVPQEQANTGGAAVVDEWARGNLCIRLIANVQNSNVNKKNCQSGIAPS